MNEGTTDDYPVEVSLEEEILTVKLGARPHVVLLGAGASRAALPTGDRYGRPTPVLREIADEMNLVDLFPQDLRDLARNDFEAAYSELFDRHDEVLPTLNDRVYDYFSQLRIPAEPNLYDLLNLCLREEDVIFTFNWDPLIVQSRIRLAKLGLHRLPKLFFLHGNVAIGYCEQDEIMGVAGHAGIRGRPCSRCNRPFTPSRLLYLVKHKDYQSDIFTALQWKAIRECLKDCFMLTVFGYSAPKTDVEAIELLKQGWGRADDRQFEQTEIINRPGCDQNELRQTWDPFIHTHHYDIFEDFHDSWAANHPRRTFEAFVDQYLDGRLIENHPVPQEPTGHEELVRWFGPLLDAEASAEQPQ